jgi:hypothetical protein
LGSYSATIRKEGHWQKISLQDKVWWQWSSGEVSYKIDGERICSEKKNRLQWNIFSGGTTYYNQSSLGDVCYIWSSLRVVRCKNCISS